MNHSEASLRIHHYLKKLDNEAAADLAFLHIDHAGHNPRLAQMCLLAFLRVNDLVHALDLVEILMKNDLESDLALLIGQTLHSAGRHEQALQIAKQGLLQARGPTIGRLHFLIAQILLAMDRDKSAEAEALLHLEKAYEQMPDNVPILRVYGGALLQAGHYHQAVDILAKASKHAPAMLTIQRLYARALKHTQRYHEASKVLTTASHLNSDLTAGRLATSALLQAGHENEGRALYGQLVSERNKKLQTTFKDELQSLHARLPEARIPSSRLDWAWNICHGHSGSKPVHDRLTWESHARWGYLADIALMDWLECRQEQIHEIIAILDDLDKVQNVTSELMAKGKGALFASAHIGPMFAGPLALYQVKARNKWLSSTPRISTANYANTLISTSDQTEMQVVRRIKEALREGNIVTLAVDGAMSPAAPRIEWQGASVTYSNFTATLAFKSAVPTLFVAPYWKENGKISFILDSLPQPTKTELLHEFTVRWQEAYFASIEHYLTQDPRNLRLNGGIWRNV